MSLFSSIAAIVVTIVKKKFLLYYTLMMDKKMNLPGYLLPMHNIGLHLKFRHTHGSHKLFLLQPHSELYIR